MTFITSKRMLDMLIDMGYTDFTTVRGNKHHFRALRKECSSGKHTPFGGQACYYENALEDIKNGKFYCDTDISYHEIAMFEANENKSN